MLASGFGLVMAVGWEDVGKEDIYVFLSSYSPPVVMNNGAPASSSGFLARINLFVVFFNTVVFIIICSLSYLIL